MLVKVLYGINTKCGCVQHVIIVFTSKLKASAYEGLLTKIEDCNLQ